MAIPGIPDGIDGFRRGSLAAAALLTALCLGANGVQALSAGDRQTYRRAFDLAEKNKWERALSTTTRARDQLLAKVLRWSHYRRGRSGASFDEISTFLLDNPDWPDERYLRRRAEEAADASVADRELMRFFKIHPPVGANGGMVYAEALERAKLPWAATDTARRTWVEATFGKVIEREFLGKHGGKLRIEDHEARLERLLWDGRRPEAERMLPRVSNAARLLATARIKLMARRAGVDNAVRAVPTGLRTHPGLLYERTRWRRREGFHDLAIDLLANPPDDLVRPEKWWIERAYLARELLKAGEISQSYNLAANHGSDAGKEFAEGEFFAGWISTRFLSDHRVAYRHFSDLFRNVSYPISLARGSYWAGRAAEAAGERDLATGWYRTAGQYPTTYYGQLAAARLGIEAAPRIPDEPDVAASQRARFDRHEIVRAIRQMTEIGAQDRTRRFFIHLGQNPWPDFPEPAFYSLLADLAESTGRRDMALYAAKKAIRRGVLLMDHLFPVLRIPAEARRVAPNVEPALVLAIIRQESAYHQQAVSRVGARGLMQLMPRTARNTARKIGLGYSRSRLTEDPAYNMTLGSAYISMMLEKWSGSYVLALCSYNAGPHRAERWIREYGDPRSPEIDPVDWIEMIPFRETRNYVQRIIESVQVYRHRLRTERLAWSIEQDLAR